MTAGQVVSTQRLTKNFGDTIALRDVDLSIGAGEVFGYLGPNGAGKTTTLRLLMGMLKPTSGAAQVFGLDSWRESVGVRRRVGYVPGEPTLYPRLTGRQHVAYFAGLRGQAPDGLAMAMAARLDLDLSRQARTLSKGNRQKLALVLAMMSRPDLLILDEPTTGLDPFVQQEFYALLGEHTATGGSVLLSSHLLGEVQRVADRIGVLRAGRLVAVERLEELSAKSLHHVRAQFTEPVEAAPFQAIPQLLDVKVTGTYLSCSAPQAALDALVKQVARHDVIDFECAEAELEETFMAYYGAGNDHAS